jgi:hypothetical protein
MALQIRVIFFYKSEEIIVIFFSKHRRKKDHAFQAHGTEWGKNNYLAGQQPACP